MAALAATDILVATATTADIGSGLLQFKLLFVFSVCALNASGWLEVIYLSWVV